MFVVWAKGKHPNDASLAAKFFDNERTEMEFQSVAREKVEHDLAISHERIGSHEQESRVQAAAIRIRESHEAEQSARAEAQEQQRIDAEQLSAVYEYSYIWHAIQQQLQTDCWARVCVVWKAVPVAKKRQDADRTVKQIYYNDDKLCLKTLLLFYL